jgi:hypothetical protein
MSLVLWRRKADSAVSNPCFMTLHLTSQHLNFQFPITLIFKKFLLEVVAIERKKCREGSRHSPSFNRYGFANQLQFLLPFDALSCPPMGGGGFCWGGTGRVESMKWWCGDDDEMISFLHSFYKRNFPRAWEEHTWLFCFALLWDFCFTPFLFVRMLHLTSCISFFGKWNKLRKSFGRLENF